MREKKQLLFGGASGWKISSVEYISKDRNKSEAAYAAETTAKVNLPFQSRY